MPQPQKSKPYRVDFSQANDHHCALYAAMGMSNKFIHQKTKLSNSQISYRLRKAGLTTVNSATRTMFRDGRSAFSDTMLRIVVNPIEAELNRFLAAHIDA